MSDCKAQTISDSISLENSVGGDASNPESINGVKQAEMQAIPAAATSEDSEASLLASDDEDTSKLSTPVVATKTLKTLSRVISDETSKITPSGDAERTSNVPPSGDADKTSKVPPSGDADETSKVPPSGDSDETSNVPPSGDSEQTSKVPPSGDAEDTSKVPPSGNADKTSKVPPPGSADKTSKVPPPGSADETSKSPPSVAADVAATVASKPPPPAALLDSSEAKPPTNGDTHVAASANSGQQLQRTDSCQVIVASSLDTTSSTLKKATTCPTDLSSAASASSSIVSQRTAGPPPVKVRRKEPPQQQQQSALDQSADQQQQPPHRNYQFLAGELEYFIICGLPLSTTDQSLKRTFKGLFKKSLCDVSQVIIVPEIDSKTVLVFSGSGATPTAKASKQLSLKRMQKKLQSSLFVSRFPEDANLKNMRAYASHSEEYLYKWTRLYFCPVSSQVAEEIQCQHFLVSNLSQSLLRSPSDLLIKFSQTMPTARSFFLPVDESESPLGYMLVRFNKSEDCLACYRLLQKHYSMEMTFVSLLEVCQLPGGYLVPAHNLLNWCRLDRPGAAAAAASLQSQQSRIVLDDPVRSPYECTCHPAAQTVAPPPEKLHLVANELENVLAGSTANVDFKSMLLRLC